MHTSIIYNIYSLSDSVKVRCGSDGNYEIPADFVWPVCRTDEEHARTCHCLGDPDITDPEVG